MYAQLIRSSTTRARRTEIDRIVIDSRHAVPGALYVAIRGEKLDGHRFTRDAVKAAVMCEDVARTMHLARTLGPAPRLAQADIDALHERYRTSYGQEGQHT